MPENPGAELSSIDFGQMIGGPLNAVIDAQKQSAISSVDFINYGDSLLNMVKIIKGALYGY